MSLSSVTWNKKTFKYNGLYYQKALISLGKTTFFELLIRLMVPGAGVEPAQP